MKELQRIGVILDTSDWISGGALLVAAFALGWNVFRDVIQKPRLRVRVGHHSIVQQGVGVLAEVVSVDVVNLGPGPATASSIFARDYTGFLGRFAQDRGGLHLIPMQVHGSGSSLPCRLEVGERRSFFGTWGEGSLAAEDFTHLWVIDTLGRRHKAPKKDVRELQRAWKVAHENSVNAQG